MANLESYRGNCNLDRFATKTILIPSQITSLKFPLNLQNFSSWLSSKHISRQINLLEFSNVMISPDSVVFKGIRLSGESVYGCVQELYLGFFKKFHFFRKNYFKYQNVEVEKALLITDPWSLINYYHWILQALSRLASLDKVLIDDVKIILPYSKYRVKDDVIYDTLKAFGFEKDRVVQLKKNQKAKVQKLLMPVNAGEDEQDFSVINMVRDKITSFYEGQSDMNFGDKIYISRSKAVLRRVKNEDEVVVLLKKYNFHIVNMEEYSLSEQIAIIKNAKYVVSNHGAGLTNILFMKKDGFVLELAGEGVNRSHFYHIAAAMGLNYLYRECKKCMQTRQDDNADIIVDIPDFEKDLKLMF